VERGDINPEFVTECEYAPPLSDAQKLQVEIFKKLKSEGKPVPPLPPKVKLPLAPNDWTLPLQA